MRGVALLLPAMLLTLPTSVHGQARQTMGDAVRSALRMHPSVAAAEATVARSEAAMREASASLLPAAAVEASATRHEEPMLVAPLHGFDIRNLPVFDPTLVQGALTVGYTAFDGGARGGRRLLATSQRRAAEASLESTRGLLMVETARRYLAVVTLREQASAQAARVGALERERERGARLLAEGRAARVVLLRAEAGLSAARAELAGLTSQLSAAERELARLTGGTVMRVVGAFVATVSNVLVDRDEALDQARVQSPELRRLQAQVEGAQAMEDVAASQYWPRVQAGGRYLRFGSGAGDAGGEWQAGLQLSYSLFTAGARPATREQARAGVRLARAELALGEMRLGSAVDAALGQMEAAAARTAAWSDAVAQAAEVARIERLALDSGAGVQSDYLTAEAELLRARAALAEARAAELLARIEIARLTGELSPEWLDRNVESGS